MALLVGFADAAEDSLHPSLFNALALVEAGGWRVAARKQLLPSYDVFDETRYFRPSEGAAHITLRQGGRDWRIGLTICEDLWVEDELHDRRLVGPDPVGG